jgi:hydrogenase nickel incorporation protein HypB
MPPRIVELRANILEKNDALARALRAEFDQSGTLVTNWVSSPGSGKTAFLERTLTECVAHGLKAAALVGDCATENDARRLARSGAPVRQIVTDGICHLEAGMVRDHLAAWGLGPVDFLFIENVGNLVCPSSYDLGEDCRVVLLSVTEGEDKPLKYPSLFQSADVAILTKVDLAQAVEFDRDTALANIDRVRPGLPVFETSAKTGTGIADWLAFLRARQAAKVGQPSRA